MIDPATLAYYERNAPHYTASGSQSHSRHLDEFLESLVSGAAILEMGCGAGHDAAHMEKRGFQVDATDGAAAMVKKVRERHGIIARRMTFDQLTATNRYDAIWAHASLLHLPRSTLPSVIAAIYAALKPNGLHFANYKLGDETHYAEGRDLLGRWTSSPSPQWLEDLYIKAGFAIVARQRYRGHASDGTQRDWLALTVSKT